jgi:uncharacterized protein YvpB
MAGVIARRLVLYLALCLILAACAGAEASEQHPASVETPRSQPTATAPTTVVVVTNGALSDAARRTASRVQEPSGPGGPGADRVGAPSAAPTATPTPPAPKPPPPPTPTPPARSPGPVVPPPPDLAGRADVHLLPVPYRSQLDGNPYELANCGPASIAMVLAAYGQDVPTMDVRKLVNKLQGTEGMYDTGTLIQNIQVVAQRYGLKPSGLYGGTPKSFHRWTLDEVRQSIDAGRPVIPQVWYRGLPGREQKAYDGDHYVVLTGYVGDEFIYNDPIDKDGAGFARRMSAAQVDKAWRSSDFPYAGVAIGGPTDRPSLRQP